MERKPRIDGRVSRAQKQREERRVAVLTTARQIFFQKGYHETSIDDIIAEAGIARGTFYLYFESKRAIFDELLDELFVTLTATARRIDTRPDAPPPVVQLEATVRQAFRTLRDNRELARLLLREAVGIDVDFDRKLHDFYGRIEELIASAIRSGMEMGLVRPCSDQTVARCVLGAVKEVVYHTFVESRVAPKSSEENQLQDLDRVGRELIAFVLSGLTGATS